MHLHFILTLTARILALVHAHPAPVLLERKIFVAAARMTRRALQFNVTQGAAVEMAKLGYTNFDNAYESRHESTRRFVDTHIQCITPAKHQLSEFGQRLSRSL